VIDAKCQTVTVRRAAPADRPAIYRARHSVYAAELGQHAINDAGELRDALDAVNEYFLMERGAELVGFVSVTPPEGGRYSIEKYVARDTLPFRVDERTYEIRLLTVLEPFRGHKPNRAALLLMYAALRYVESRGGTRVIAMGRDAVLPLYRKAGLRPTGIATRCGSVNFEVLHARVADLRTRLERKPHRLGRLSAGVDWRLDFPFRETPACFHGGRFFEAIGERFDDLDRRHEIINADVLDAWFPPSPKVLDALREHLPWLARTSPPTGCRGMIDAVADARGLPPEAVLPGAGSSDLIYLALRHWLTSVSRALILDPTYGEYSHVLERMIGCDVDRLPLSRDHGYAPDPVELAAALRRGYDLVVLVNPNSPTGRHLDRDTLHSLLRRVPARTRVWIDETYVEYAGLSESLERFAAASRSVIVCKSMSKVYALSGLRAAYLVGPTDLIAPLRAISPPWALSLPAQVAAVKALEDPAYYAMRYRQTHALRRELVAELRECQGLQVLPGVANFALCHLPPDGPSAAAVVEHCRQRGVFLRDAAAMGTRLGTHAIRIAVKDREANRRIVEVLRGALGRIDPEALGDLSAGLRKTERV
jgi:histidinol-phosphate/aromatic aminotransferase/cobyric acid decarboxylase-like protein